MLTYEEKISHFENSLHKLDGNYSDNIKQDIIVYFNEFNPENKRLYLLKKINSFDEIDIWIERLTSRIILKFDSESEQINDFIYDFIEFYKP
jgi:hypothetical protein